MSLSHLLTATPAVHVSAAAESGGSGRAGSTAAIALALIGVGLGVWALRSVGRRGVAIASAVLSLAGLVVGVVALLGADGGVGTGNGRGGAIVSIVLGVVGLVIGGLALARSGRPA